VVDGHFVKVNVEGSGIATARSPSSQRFTDVGNLGLLRSLLFGQAGDDQAEARLDDPAGRGSAIVQVVGTSVY
jgi:hypothetical protein